MSGLTWRKFTKIPSWAEPDKKGWVAEPAIFTGECNVFANGQWFIPENMNTLSSVAIVICEGKESGIELGILLALEINNVSGF